jgi:flagellar basal body-associated protein FliL
LVCSMNKFDLMNKDVMNRMEEIVNSTKLNEFLHRKEEEDKKKNCILWVLAIIGAVAAVAGIAYAVYRFFTPDYLDDFEDDFDDDFDDDFFEDEDAEKKAEK